MTTFAQVRNRFPALASQSQMNILQTKKGAVVTLRWLLVIAAAYLMLFSGPTWPSLGVSTIVVLLMASNVAIGRLPERLVTHAGFDLVLLLVDTSLLTAGFYLTKTISSDFYILYFFVVFLAGVSENLRSVLMGSMIAAVAYLALAWSELAIVPKEVLRGSLPLRVFFIFAVALFYGFLVERIRVDRERRQKEYVAQLENLNKRLHELVELREAFVGAVSHELRTPLNAMLGYIDLLREGTVGEVKGPVWAYVDKAYRRGQHLMQLIEELLSFSDLSKGRAELQLAEIDIADLLDKVRGSVAPPALARGLQVRFEVSPGAGNIRTDKAKLLQVILHLVTNAIKFTEQGEIVVTAARCHTTLSSGWEGAVLELKVQDTGPGIPAEVQQAIFEEFRQLDGSATRRHGGIGLGLSVCRGLVQLLGGDISLESTVGKGTTFAVRLPAESPRAAGILPAAHSDADREASRRAIEIAAGTTPPEKAA